MIAAPKVRSETPGPTDAQILLAIREDLREKVAPELSSNMASTVCRMAIDLISRMLVRSSDWPDVLHRQIVSRAAVIEETVTLLAGSLNPADRESARALISTLPPQDAGIISLEDYNRRLADQLAHFVPEAMALAARDPSKTPAMSAIIRSLVESEDQSEQSVVNAGVTSSAAFHEDRAAAEAAVSHDQLQAYLTRKFPDKDVRLISLQELSGGFGKTTILFEVEGLEARPSSLVIRRDRKAGATESTVADEFPLLNALRHYDLPTPDPLWAETDPGELALPFMVVRRKAGAIAGSLWAPDKAVCGPETGLDLARVMARLHAIPLDKLPQTGIWAPRSPTEAMARNIEYITDLWARTQQEVDPVMDMCLRWLSLNQPPPPARIVPVHADLGFQNLLVENQKISGLLDWELSHPGDPNEDLCYVRSYVEQLLPWEEFLAEYHAHGGCEYLEDRTNFYEIWRDVRNTVFTALCHKAFCTDANTDIRFGHTGVVYYRMMTLDAARRIAALQ
ncbi:phosphotransferase family protein [Sphingobium sp. JS3065]|uniref:phosphotransferase family protein n=1 Tax=Sphingobium sp. JS3065 TaxID=2970925 RepID=UPI0022646456|nr:phosphotransferase family protein [Sphingobium sp. JS3065]UZW57063.1 phosphotransferase family protein [Sphingobium sp. JS3065]